MQYSFRILSDITNLCLISDYACLGLPPQSEAPNQQDPQAQASPAH